MTLFSETLAVRTHCKRVVWRLTGQQVHGGNELLTDNKTRIQVAALIPSPSKHPNNFLDG
jgi:hypothetical protein